jgi:hypothetical protein
LEFAIRRTAHTILFDLHQCRRSFHGFEHVLAALFQKEMHVRPLVGHSNTKHLLVHTELHRIGTERRSARKGLALRVVLTM